MKADQAWLQGFAIRYTEAWCSQNPTAVAEFFSSDGSLTINDGAPCVGRAAIAEAARGFMEAFPDLRVVMDELLVAGDRIEYHWTLSGHNSGRGGAGRHVRISGFESWRFDAAGLIENSVGHFDAASYHRQISGS